MNIPKPSFIGAASRYTQRSDLSELSMCKGRQERCKYPPGYHEAQEAADKAWRAAKKRIEYYLADLEADDA